RHTRFSRDWSSDVCSSDLGLVGEEEAAVAALGQSLAILRALGDRCGEAQVLNHYGNLLRTSGDQAAARRHYADALQLARDVRCRSEERRVGKGGRGRSVQR